MWKNSLCYSCKHKRESGNKRGSIFWMCKISGRIPTISKYPPQPVNACQGYDKGRPEEPKKNE